MKKVFLLVAVMATMMLGMQAQEPARVPAYRGLIERVQPNGDTLRTYLRGDEHKHWMMTEDGWQIIQTDDDKLCYAVKKKDGTIVASKKQAHDTKDRKKCEVRWLKRKGVNKIEN